LDLLLLLLLLSKPPIPSRSSTLKPANENSVDGHEIFCKFFGIVGGVIRWENHDFGSIELEDVGKEVEGKSAETVPLGKYNLITTIINKY
jgi:hypothetical protein